MEIVIDRRLLVPLGVLMGVLVVVGLTLLGRAYTPDPARVIRWADWQAAKVERQYRRELAGLRQDLSDLAEMLRDNPDPVRAEMAASRVAQRHADGLGLLARQREAVVAAAEVVRDWAAGYAGYDEAVAAVNAAVEVLDNTGGGGDADDR